MSDGGVLAVLVDRPWPAVTGARRRLQAMLDALEPGGLRVYLAASEAGPVEGGVPVDVAIRRSRAPASAARALLGAPSRRPPMMAFYRQPAVRRRLRELVAVARPHAVVTHHLGGAGLVDGIVDPARLILDLPDYDVERFSRFAELSSGPAKVRWRVEEQLTAQWLRRNLPRVAAVTVTSERDADALRALAPSARISVAPNGTSIEGPRRSDPAVGSLLFLGDLAYLPNRDGVEWFVAEVVPLLPPSTPLRIVGRGPAIRGPGVVSVGFVPELAREWAQATAMIVPLRAGGGTRLKVLDAFGHGVPVVSTSIGMEGLDATEGEHYLRAETPAEWSDAVRLVLADAPLRERLAAAGRRLAEERFTWGTTMRPLVSEVARLAGR